MLTVAISYRWLRLTWIATIAPLEPTLRRWIGGLMLVTVSLPYPSSVEPSFMYSKPSRSSTVHAVFYQVVRIK